MLYASDQVEFKFISSHLVQLSQIYQMVLLNLAQNLKNVDHGVKRIEIWVPETPMQCKWRLGTL